MTGPEAATAPPKRFRVALSFPGEHRPFVEAVADRLSAHLGRQGVLYDKYYEAEFARPDLDTYLQRLYHDESELIAVFLCADYECKEWCGLEWRAIRDLIKKRRTADVMPLRFDDTEIPGLFSTDGYVWISERPPEEVADLILARLELNTGAAADATARVSAGPKPIHLPYPSLGALFKGRESILDDLAASLRRTGEGQATAVVGKALHGLGGVGKTRLAVEYAWQHADEHSALLFVPGDTPESLHRNLAALAGPAVLDLPERQQPEEEVRLAAVLRWLRDHPGWLLILDNLDTKEAATAAEDLLARLQGGHVLLTSRLSDWSIRVEALPLDLLAEGDAVAFLLARTDARRRKQPDDATEAHTVAIELGCLALALEQAGAYIAHHRLTLAGYLKAWKAQHDKVLTWYDERLMQYPRSVAVTWQTSVNQLTDPAHRLLQRLAWLAPDPIPESLLETPIPGAEPSDPQEALAELDTYSLATRPPDAPTFTVHRLVQDVTRRSLQPDLATKTLTEALGWVNAAFKGDPHDVRTWPTLDPLAPHARAIVAHADETRISDPTGELMNQLGGLLHARARHGDAEPLKRRALALVEETLGPDHRDVAAALNNLAQLLQDTNRRAEAEPLMRRALAIDERSLGCDHPEVATDLNNLAMLFKDTNRPAEAEPLLRQALAIDEQNSGPGHPNIARDLNNLAVLLEETNRLAEAEPLVRRALAIGEETFEASHPTVAIRLNNLAQLLLATDRLAEAEPLMRRALAIVEQRLGFDHPKVATALNNLAVLLRASDRLAEAEPLMRRALTIDEESLGPDHPKVAIRLNNLAQLLQATGRMDEAEPLIRRALAIDEESLGHDHPNVAIALNNLAVLLRATDRLAEAEPLMRRHVGILLGFAQRTGHEHRHLQNAFDNYRHLLEAIGKSDEEIEAALASLQRPEPEDG
jgi:tetratricopeptide (TPR) repeat protein